MHLKRERERERERESLGTRHSHKGQGRGTLMLDIMLYSLEEPMRVQGITRVEKDANYLFLVHCTLKRGASCLLGEIFKDRGSFFSRRVL